MSRASRQIGRPESPPVTPAGDLTGGSSAELAHTREPYPRDHYVDMVRALAASVVVIGHWIVAVVGFREGHLYADYLLLVVPQTQYVTWLAQVMPVFFLVGGYANAVSWRSAQSRGEPASAWLRRRERRLIVPTAALLGCWVVLVLVLSLAGLDLGLILTGARHALGVLWFLGIYSLVVASVPVTLRLHDQYGWRAVAALVGLAAATDAARLVDVPLVGWANCAWGWLAMHQLGYCWQDGSLIRSARTAWALLIGGASAFAVLVLGLGPYSVNMLDRANTTPPSLALLALGLFHTGVVLLVRPAAQRWLQHPRLQAAVAAVNARAMTLYLWHVTAMVLVILTFVLPGVWPDVPPGSITWWALRPLWLLTLTAVTLPIVAVLTPLERLAAARSAGGGLTRRSRSS